MQQITHSKLAEIIKGKSGVSFVGLSTLTDARARKTGNPHGTILKKSRFVGVSGADYQGAVNRAADGGGEFVADSLPWGEFVPDSGRKLIAHKGGLYLRLQTTGKQRKRKGAAVVEYFGNTGKLTREQVAPFLPATNSAKQSAHGISEENQVQVRTFSFESIQVIRINGKSFRLVQD